MGFPPGYNKKLVKVNLCSLQEFFSNFNNSTIRGFLKNLSKILIKNFNSTKLKTKNRIKSNKSKNKIKKVSSKKNNKSQKKELNKKK